MAWVVPVVAVQGFLLLVAVPVISGLCILRKHVCVYMYYMLQCLCSVLYLTSPYASSIAINGIVCNFIDNK